MYRNISKGRVSDSCGVAIEWVLNGDKVTMPVSGKHVEIKIRGNMDGFDDKSMVVPGLYHVEHGDDENQDDDFWYLFNPDFEKEAA